jgi:diamine N-acetyltransferase
MAVALAEITDQNRAAVLALRVAPGPERFVGSVHDALADADEYPHANPWYRAVAAGGVPAGFYARLGFVPTGQLDGNGEVIASLALP